jgi:hypothetical protein
MTKARLPSQGFGEGPSLVFKGDFFDQILRGNVVGTSYGGVPLAKVSTMLRFCAEFTSAAGEDYLFWMSGWFKTWRTRGVLQECRGRRVARA